jgi:hypothetical protein
LPGKSNPPNLEQLQSCEMMEDFDPSGVNTNEEGGKSKKLTSPLKIKTILF